MEFSLGGIWRSHPSARKQAIRRSKSMCWINLDFVFSQYISQVKRKCTLEAGKNYNLPKSEDAKQPQRLLEKEAAIMEVRKHFDMI